MQLALYKALKSLNMPDEAANEVLAAMDAHIENRIGGSTAALLAKMDLFSAAIGAKIDSGLSVTNSKIDSGLAATNARIDVTNAKLDAGLMANATKIDAGLLANGAKLDAFALVKSDADHQKELRTQGRRFLAGYVITVTTFVLTTGALVYGWLRTAGVV